ncbi:MAG: calcium/sodium antiporter [Thermodesulfobacteriota bacterium]
MNPTTLAFFCAGFLLLVAGAELLVRGASRLARAVGISPLVVGLTVVAFGTSSPELAVSLLSASGGQADIAVGNAVGSNIFNVLFILGLAALITPLAVSRQLVRLEVPLMVASAALLPLFAMDGRLGRLDGVLLFAAVLAYTTWAIRRSRRENGAATDEYAREYGEGGDGRSRQGYMLRQLALVVAGLALLLLGSDWLVDGAVALARAFGVGELIIGLTIIAAGTSMPEAATSVMASLRGERDIAVGNVVGSNIFNILAVLGLSAAIAPDGVPVPAGAMAFDIPVMLAASVACLPVFFTGHRIARWEGGLFFGYYLAYTGYLLLRALGHAQLGTFGVAMLWFALPLTVVTLAVTSVRAWRRGVAGAI